MIGYREDSHPRFLVDCMLGKLARWLRVLGYDTLYYRKIDDRLIIEIALAEDRYLLTKDTRLALLRQRELKKMFIHPDDWRGQLKEVLNGLKIGPAELFSRCLVCNSPLEVIEHKEAEGEVPEYTMATQPSFHRCPECRKIFWPGSHLVEMKKVLFKEGLLISS